MTPEKIGRYHVVNLLGQGGFAAVYLANDPFVKRQVAVKVLPVHFTTAPAMRARFQQEAEIIATLEHPAIVPIYDYGEHEGQPFIVMRHMSGGTLAERIRRGNLEVEEATRILKRISSALDRAHDQGIIHRDLKPGNILFDQYGEAYLSDFGIARLTEANLELTGGGTIGTPAYMSPEQVYGDRPVDRRSDVYALGVILFEMLTGSVPYKADTPAKLMMKHIMEPVPRILAVKPDLPPGCDQLLERVMAKEPNDRFDRATDFATAVTLLHPTIHSPQPPPPTAVPAPVTPPTPEPTAASFTEETMLETPTPPEVQRMAQSTPAPAPALSQPTEISSPTPPPQSPAPGPQSPSPQRPSWLIPALAAAGALFVIVLILGLILSQSGLFGGPEDAVENPTAETASTDGETDNSEGVADPPARPTNEPSVNRPQAAEGGLLPRQISNFGQVSQLGRGYLTQLAVSPDGAVLAAGSGIGIWIYNTENMEPLGLLEGHTGPVTAVAWSPDGRFLASGSQDGQIFIWSAESREVVRTLENHTDMITSLDWSFDSQRLASGSLDQTVRIWDGESGELIYALTGHTDAVRMVSWPFDHHDRIASASEDGTVKVWLMDTGELDFTIEQNDSVEAVLWVVDGGRLLSGTADGMIHVWNAGTGEPLDSWQAHEYGLITMQQTPSGWNMVSTGSDGFINLWEVDTGLKLASWSGDTNSPLFPAWLPDSKTIALSFTDNLLGIWPADDPTEGISTRLHTGQISSIAWLPEGSPLPVGNGLVSGHFGENLTRFWNLNNRQQTAVLPGFTADGQSLSISADGQYLARPDVQIEVFDLSAGLTEDIEPFLSEGADSYVNVAALSPDAEQVAAINFDGILNVWNLADQSLQVEVEGAGFGAMAWSPEGDLIASPALDDSSIIIWDSQSGERLDLIPLGYDANISGLDWSPDGQWLAAVDTAGTLNIWERDGWGLAVTFQSRGSSLNSIDWSPNGRWLAAGSWSGSIYVWDATTIAGTDPVLYLDLAHLAPVVAIAWSPDGRQLASGSHDGTVKIWGAGNQ